jgi:hypothetical protein
MTFMGTLSFLASFLNISDSLRFFFDTDITYSLLSLFLSKWISNPSSPSVMTHDLKSSSEAASNSIKGSTLEPDTTSNNFDSSFTNGGLLSGESFIPNLTSSYLDGFGSFSAPGNLAWMEFRSVYPNWAM